MNITYAGTVGSLAFIFLIIIFKEIKKKCRFSPLNQWKHLNQK